MSDTNYAGVAELGRDTLPRMGIGVSFVDASDSRNVAEALRPETRLIWLETPANPIVRLTDLAAVAQVAASHPGVRMAVDSTFATPVATRPLELGADYVMHSLTKYIGGHGDAVGGAVLGSRKDISALRLEAGDPLRRRSVALQRLADPARRGHPADPDDALTKRTRWPWRGFSRIIPG